MTIIQKLRARQIIARVAAQHGISVSECRSEMIAAIRATDPERLSHLVGEGRVPTPEELILLICKETT